MKVEKNNADAYLMRVNLILIRMEEAKHRILQQLVKMVPIKPLKLKLLIRGIGMFFLSSPTMTIYLIKYGSRLHKMLQNTISITKLNNGIPSEVS